MIDPGSNHSEMHQIRRGLGGIHIGLGPHKKGGHSQLVRAMGYIQPDHNPCIEGHHRTTSYKMCMDSLTETLDSMQTGRIPGTEVDQYIIRY